MALCKPHLWKGEGICPTCEAECKHGFNKDDCYICEVERLRAAIAVADEALSNANVNDVDMLHWVDVAWHALREVRPDNATEIRTETGGE